MAMDFRKRSRLEIRFTFSADCVQRVVRANRNSQASGINSVNEDFDMNLHKGLKHTSDGKTDVPSAYAANADPDEATLFKWAQRIQNMLCPEHFRVFTLFVVALANQEEER